MINITDKHIYTVKRIKNESSELYHWGKKKDHKYVARVKQKNGKYRYFYDKAEYEAYIHGDKKSDKKSFFDRLKDSAKKFIDKHIKTKVKDFVKKFKKQIDNGKKWVENKLKIDDKKDTSSKKNKPKYDPDKSLIPEKEKKNHKYVKKVQLPNGKWRYFYKESEYESYMKRLEYQKNEPEFMKNLKKIPDDVIETKEECMAEINEDYSPFFEEDSMNCMYCTTAYELRQRGYDVEAADFDEATYQGQLRSPEDWYEDADIQYIFQNGKTKDMNFLTDTEESWNKYADNTYMYDFDYDSEKVEQAITKKSPPNSRGNLMVFWRSGGAHSMVYEVDSNNDVIIRDCQTNNVYTLDDILPHTYSAMYVRTDNLKLKKGVLDTIVEN